MESSHASSIVAYVCPLCESTQSVLREWFSHLGAAHSNDPSFFVTCGIDGCKCTYRKLSALKSHVYRHHKAKMQVKSTAFKPTPPLVIVIIMYFFHLY